MPLNEGPSAICLKEKFAFEIYRSDVNGLAEDADYHNSTTYLGKPFGREILR